MHIEIWSDFICPFCYIGKKRFEAALEKFPHRDDVEITFKSYQLDPDTPEYNGKSYYENLAKKAGSIDQAKQMAKNMQEQGRSAGLEFDFDQAKVANTLNGHRLNKLAEEEQKQKQLSEKLFSSHFVEGIDIGNRDELLAIANEVGLDEVRAKQVLDDDTAFYEAVQTDISEAKQFGITSVPTFIFNRKYAVSGAQPEEAYIEAMEQVWQEENEQSPLQDLSSTEPNAGDGCAIPKSEE